jgi:phosphoribosylamine--glycine ligase
LQQSGAQVLCAPGNVGIEEVARTYPISVEEEAQLADLAQSEKVDLVVVGPEAPLVAGLTDLLESRDLAVFGCSKAAAIIEGSKAFAKAFMARHKIPTAAFGAFSDPPEAELFIDTLSERGVKLVVKADGLAAGKGVSLCENALEAKREVQRMVHERALGDAGKQVIIEEFLVGQEASLMALVDGEQVLPLPAAEDHKTIFDGDKGPMTGGMGAISPTPVLDDLTIRRVVRDVLEPAARGLGAEGRRFRGLLYAGLMLTDEGPKVLEFNCRVGDPETQAVLPRIDGDFAALLHGVATSRMPTQLRISEQAAVCLVLAAGGYPGPPQKGEVIEGLSEAGREPGVQVFHAGTARREGKIVTAGGRVLGVTSVGDDVAAARASAYRAAEKIKFNGKQMRRDIGARPYAKP